jgi:serine/threonine protein kinase
LIQPAGTRSLLNPAGKDEELRQEVESLMACDEQADRPSRFLAFELKKLLADGDLSSRPAQLDQGQLLGPYRILAPLGMGGMGEVYSATDTRLERMVAIKLLPRQFVEDAHALKRFQREARAASRFEPPEHLHGL